MNRFETLAAAAKQAQTANCNARKTLLAGGSAVDGIFQIYVSPVQGRIRHLNTVKMTCYIDGVRVSKVKMQEAMA